MAYYFFTDIDLLSSQNPHEAFGPLTNELNSQDNDPYNKFRVTDRHTTAATGNNAPFAYAICDGDVFIQDETPTSNPATVCLIFRPTKLPDLHLPKIKYIIYKGILKDSLIDGTGPNATVAEYDSSAGAYHNIDILKRVKDNNDQQPGVNASELYSTQPANSKISDVFFFESGTQATSQYVTVNGGFSLGRFSQNFGLEIIVDHRGFEPDFNWAKNPDNKIEAISLPTPTFTQKEYFIHRNSKEKLLHFLDPCAFWGSFYGSVLTVKQSNGSSDEWSGSGVYTNVLDGITTPALFVNRNKIYLDIRNEFNSSFDFYNVYQQYDFSTNQNQNFLRLAFNGQNTFEDIDYYQNFRWPLLSLDFQINNQSLQTELEISFPRGENNKPIVFGSKASIKRNFIERLFSKRKRFIFTKPELNNSNYTQGIKIEIPSITSSGTVPICSYVILKYLKQSSQCPLPESDGTILRSAETGDNLFMPFDMPIEWQTPPDQLRTRVFEEEVAVDLLGMNGNYFIGSVGVAIDSDANTTFFAYANENLVKKEKSKSFALDSDSVESDPIEGLSFLRYVADKHKMDWQAYDLLPAPAIPITIAESLIPKKGSQPKPDDLFSLTIPSIGSVDFLEAIKPYRLLFLQDFKIHLGIKLVEGGTDVRGASFVKWQLMVWGWVDDDQNTGTIKLKSINIQTVRYHDNDIESDYSDNPATRLYIYRTSGRYHIESYQNIAHVGQAYDLERMADVQDFPAPGNNGFYVNSVDQSTTIPKYKIKCKIYVLKNWNLTQNEFCIYKDYLISNIQKLWDSSTNKGIGTYYDPVVNQEGVGTFYRRAFLDASGIEIEIATAENLTKLNANEILILIEHSDTKRSWTTSAPNSRGLNGRTGIQYFQRNRTPGDEANDHQSKYANTAAHEFGHTLGLTDRYTYVARARLQAELAKLVDDDDYFIGATALYLGQYALERNVVPDVVYASRFNWMHNMMVTRRSVPEDDTNASDLFINNKTFRRFHEYFRPESSGSIVTIFVTPDQVDKIINGTIEDFQLYLNFREWDFNELPDPTGVRSHFKGSFVGPGIVTTNNNEKRVLSDESIVRNIPDFIDNFQPGFDTMDGRIFNSSGNGYTGTFFCAYNPFRAPGTLLPFGNYLDERKVLDDTAWGQHKLEYINYPSEEGPANGYSIYDIMLGGHAYNSIASKVALRTKVNMGELHSMSNPIIALGNIPRDPESWERLQETLGINGRRLLMIAIYIAGRTEQANTSLTEYEEELLQIANQIDDGTLNKDDKYQSRGFSFDTAGVTGYDLWNLAFENNEMNTVYNISLIAPNNPDYEWRANQVATPYETGNRKIPTTKKSYQLPYQVYINRKTILKIFF